jgi:hypothetical protein
LPPLTESQIQEAGTPSNPVIRSSDKFRELLAVRDANRVGKITDLCSPSGSVRWWSMRDL